MVEVICMKEFETIVSAAYIVQFRVILGGMYLIKSKAKSILKILNL